MFSNKNLVIPKKGFVFDLENWIYKNIDYINKSIKNTEEFSNMNIKKVNKLYKNKSRINALRIWKLFFCQSILMISLQGSLSYQLIS